MLKRLGISRRVQGNISFQYYIVICYVINLTLFIL